MQRLNLSITLALVGVLAAACATPALAQEAEATKPDSPSKQSAPNVEPLGPDSLSLSRVSEARFAASQAAIAELVEKYQSPEGRDPKSPNAYLALIQAIEAKQRVDKLTWLNEDGTLRDAVPAPDYDAIYLEASAEPKRPEHIAAIAQLPVLRASEMSAHLDTMAKTPRVVRPAPRTPEHARMMRAAGTDAAEEQAVSGYLLERLQHDIGAVRALTRVGLATMHTAAAEGDSESLLRSFEHNLALARVMSHGTTLIERLVADAIIVLTVNNAAKVVEKAFSVKDSEGSDKLTDPRFLLAVDAAMTRQLGNRPPLTAQIAGERLTFLDTVDMVYGSGNTPVPASLARLAGREDVPEIVLKRADRGQELAMGQTFYDEAIRMAEAPWAASKSQLHKFERDGEFGSERVPPLLGIVSFAAKKVKAVELRSDAAIASFRTMLAVRLHESQTGALPASLRDIKSLTDTSAMDPYTGELLGYRIVDAKHFELWAAGYDGKDDGGVFDAEDNSIATTSEPAGAGKDWKVFPPAD